MEQPPQPLLSLREIQQQLPLFNTNLGAALLPSLLTLLGIDRVNQLYAHAAQYEGWAFVDDLLQQLGVHYTVEGAHHLEQLGEGAFVTVSNHPFGALDGLLLIHLMGAKYPHYRVMANHLLARVHPLRPHLIAVNPFASSTQAAVTRQGIKEAIRLVQQGTPIGIFPAGAVSRLNSHLEVCDREWQSSVVHLIQRLHVPVLPIYFDGGNSILFYLLGLIDWRLRSLRLPHEIFNKADAPLRITIGAPIAVERQAHCAPQALAHYLRGATYALRK